MNEYYIVRLQYTSMKTVGVKSVDETFKVSYCVIDVYRDLLRINIPGPSVTAHARGISYCCYIIL